MSKRPNFLFIITDQQRADHVGFGGNDVVQTPHLNAISARGMQYNRAYVANSICTPNRCSILTGRMPSAHGAATNAISLDWYSNTFVRRLRDEGYKTALVGKGHFQDWGDLPPPFAQEIIAEVPKRTYRHDYPDDWNTFENMSRHRKERVAFPGDYYGFEHVDMVLGHSDFCSGHYEHWLREKGFDPADLLGTFTPKSPASAVYENWWQVRRPRLPAELYPSRYIAEKSCEYLENVAGKDEPFFLQVSFPDPHHPFTPPGEYWEKYRAADMPLPRTFTDQHAKSTWLARAYAKRAGNIEAGVLPFGPDEDQLRHALAAEYGMISLIDDCVGDIEAKLRELGLADNTVIVFTSDHGDMFGDHHIILKGTLHYEGCIRVPLVIADPGRHPGVSDSLVGSVDLAQTVLEMADVEGYDSMQGISLVPTLDDPGATLREALIIEDDYPVDMLRTGSPTRMRTAITKQARYTRYMDADMGELFDLSDDPDELNNRFGEDGALETAMAEQLINLMTAVSR